MITIIIKNNLNTISETIKEEQQQQQQPSAQDGGGCGGARSKQRECPRPKLCTLRQSAGNGNVEPPAEESRTVFDKSSLDRQRQRISELKRKLAALNTTDGPTSNYSESRHVVADPLARRPIPADDYRVASSGCRVRGGDDNDDCSGGAAARPARSAERHHLDSGLLFKRSELRSMLDFTGECFEEASSMLRSRRSNLKSVSLAQLNERSAKRRGGDESDEPPSDA